MTLADSNAATVREYISAFLSEDYDTARSFLSETVSLTVPGRNPLSGERRGKDESVLYLQHMGELTQGTLRFEVRDVLANDEHVVVLFEPSASRTGKDWTSRTVTVYRLVDAKIEEIVVYQQDLYAFDAFMS